MFFGLTVLCGVGMLVARATMPAPEGNEWRGLNQLPWGIARLLFLAIGSLTSLIGFCLGLAGVIWRPQQKRIVAVLGVILNGPVAWSVLDLGSVLTWTWYNVWR
jgi:hypothetical protein